MKLRTALALCLALLLGACASFPGAGTRGTFAPGSDEAARLDNLLTHTRDLLLLAPDVARIKWNDKLPVENRRAEAALVENATRQAARYQADPALFRDYFQAQVDASKYVQNALFDQWKAANTPKLTLTRTVAQVQAASDALTPALMQALADATPVLKIAGARGAIEARAREIMPTRSALSDPTRALAIKPLLDRAAP